MYVIILCYHFYLFCVLDSLFFYNPWIIFKIIIITCSHRLPIHYPLSPSIDSGPWTVISDREVHVLLSWRSSYFSLSLLCSSISWSTSSVWRQCRPPNKLSLVTSLLSQPLTLTRLIVLTHLSWWQLVS